MERKALIENRVFAQPALFTQIGDSSTVVFHERDRRSRSPRLRRAMRARDMFGIDSEEVEIP